MVAEINERRYSPDGAMVSKVVAGANAGSQKYIIDRVGEIPVVLMVLDAANGDFDKPHGK